MHYISQNYPAFSYRPCTKSPHTAVVLKTTSEHLNWHPSINEYRSHKANLVRAQGAADSLIHHAGSGASWIANQSAAVKKPYGSKGSAIIDKGKLVFPNYSIETEIADFRMAGSFNLKISQRRRWSVLSRDSNLRKTLDIMKEFPGLEHRLEFVAKKKNRSFYNDSYATRPDATMGAIRSFQEKASA